MFEPVEPNRLAHRVDVALQVLLFCHGTPWSEIEHVSTYSVWRRILVRTGTSSHSVEAVLSDIILLGTEEHVRLAERAARELVAGRPLHTYELVISLRNFIRDALDLDPIPADLEIPKQAPRGHQVLVAAAGSGEMRMSDKARVEEAVAARVPVLVSALVSH